MRSDAEHVRLVHPRQSASCPVADRVEAEGAAGVVDQQPAGRDGGDERVDRVAIGDVEVVGGGTDLGGERLEPVEPAGADDDVEAFRGQAAGGGGADAGRRPGHHRHPAFHGATLTRVAPGRARQPFAAS